VPVFSHVLILKDGRVLAAGRKSAVLATKLLSRAFAARLRLEEKKNRYSLTVLPKARGLM